MRNIIPLFVCLAACVSGMESAWARQIPDFETRIVGGVPAGEAEFPFIVSLQENSEHFCGGTLIRPDWVLTAAHCVRGMSEGDLEVVLGAERHIVLRAVEHPLFRHVTDADHDFALLQLERDSSFLPLRIQRDPLVIPGFGEAPLLATTAGWGSLIEGGDTTRRLMKVEVPLVGQERCRAVYPNKITDEMICAGYEDGGKDSCQGDSGGPLVLRLGTADPALIGVVSWGHGCGRPGYFGVYSKVSAVAAWIEEETGR